MVAFSEVKERVSLTDAVAMLGLNLSEHNGALRGACPSCNAGGARALVVTEGKGYYCFHGKKGGDQIALAAHVKGISLREAGEFLAGARPPHKEPEQPTTGMKPLSHLKHQHEQVQKIMTEESAIAFGVGFTTQGIMRGCVAVPIRENGGIIAYVGIDENGLYRFPNGFAATHHLFNADQVTGTEVQFLPSVQDVLRAYDAGITDCICFLSLVVSQNQVKMLADWLEDTGRNMIL